MKQLFKASQLLVAKFTGAVMLFFLVTVSFSQPLNYSFNHLNVKDGLSHGIVNAFCIDKEGFMWIGTYDGLNRFDGTRFNSFKSNRYNKNSLAHNTVHDLCVDQQDNIWCLTEGGVSKYNKQTGLFENYILTIDSSSKPLLPFNGAILCDRKGRIWCASYGGLSEYNPVTNKFKTYSHVAGDSTSLSESTIGKHDMKEDSRESKIWLATSKGLNCFDTDKKIAYHAKNNPEHLQLFNTNVIYPICRNSGDEIVYGDNTLHQLCFYNTITKKFRTTPKILQNNEYNTPTDAATIYRDSRGYYWVITWGYLTHILDPLTFEVTSVRHDDADPTSISSTFAWCIMEDKEGTIWYGGVNGISYSNPKKSAYQIFHPGRLFPDIKYQQRLNSFYEEPNGTLWFGSNGAGLFSYNFSTNKYENYLFEARIKSIEEDKNTIYSIIPIKDEIWMGSLKGIQKFDLKKKQFVPHDTQSGLNKFSNSMVRFLTKESDSIVWFNIYDDGLYRFNIENGKYQRWNKIVVDSIEADFSYVTFISLDSKKRLWIGAKMGQFIKYENTLNKFSLIPLNEKDTAAMPQSPSNIMVEDADGNLWAPLKGKGIVRYNPETGKARIWNSSDGLVFDQCLAIAKDLEGKIWVSAYNLASVFDPKSNTFKNFRIEYANSNYSYYNRMLTLRNGTIVSAILDAFVLFDPAKIKSSGSLPNVLISSFKVFEKPVLFSGNNPLIQLSYRENYFSIEYSVLTGIDRSDIEYQYMLEGFDKDWIQAGKRQYAAYTNVPGGNYKFKIRSRRGADQWSTTEASLNISITKIFYQTWWFRFLVALLIFIIIRVYVRYREQQQLEKSEQEAIQYFTNSQYTNNSPDEILWDLARNVISRLGFIDCVIYLLDETKNKLIQTAALDNKKQEGFAIANPLEINVGEGIVGTVAATARPEIIDDTSKDKRYILDDQMRLSEIAVPIIHKDKVIGVIDSEHHQKNFFTNRHLDLLTTIAAISSDKIANAISRKELQEKELKLLEFDKKVAEVKLTALRAQMNPHFIFNCLNAIDNFILKNNPDEASRYLNKFARLIRAILTEADKNYISLKTEIELLKNYIELENLRFEEKFEYSFVVTGDINTADLEIPPMLIQPFVENAIIHGLAHKKGIKQLTIELQLEDEMLKCTIQDSGVGRNEAMRINESKTQTHESKGMNITKNRFDLFQQHVKEAGSVKIIDLFDENNLAVGTRIELMLPVEMY